MKKSKIKIIYGLAAALLGASLTALVSIKSDSSVLHPPRIVREAARGIKRNFLAYFGVSLALFFFAFTAVVPAKDAAEKSAVDRAGQGDFDKTIREFLKGKKTDIDLRGVYSQGSENAPVEIVLYGDFNCGACKSAGERLRKLLDANRGKVRLYYKHFPLGGDCASLRGGRKDPEAGSCIAAAAAWCANKQGKYPDMYRLLYRDLFMNVTHTEESATKNARKAGLNREAFERCLGADETRLRLTRDTAECENAGFTGTPTVLINRRIFYQGARDLEPLQRVVDYLAKKR